MPNFQLFLNKDLRDLRLHGRGGSSGGGGGSLGSGPPPPFGGP